MFAPCPATVTPSSHVTDQVLDLALPCFQGDSLVAVAGLGKPAVVNLWASWCSTCRLELPEFQTFFSAVSEKVIVLGVNTGDTRSAGAAAGVDFGVRYPSLYDPDSKLLRELGYAGLPVTLFIDSNGVVRHAEVGGVMTQDTLHADTLEYLNVRL